MNTTTIYTVSAAQNKTTTMSSTMINIQVLKVVKSRSKNSTLVSLPWNLKVAKACTLSKTITPSQIIISQWSIKCQFNNKNQFKLLIKILWSKIRLRSRWRNRLVRPIWFSRLLKVGLVRLWVIRLIWWRNIHIWLVRCRIWRKIVWLAIIRNRKIEKVVLLMILSLKVHLKYKQGINSRSLAWWALTPPT